MIVLVFILHQTFFLFYPFKFFVFFSTNNLNSLHIYLRDEGFDKILKFDYKLI